MEMPGFILEWEGRVILVTLGYAQDSLLALHSGINPGALGGRLYVVLDIELKLAACKITVLFFQHNILFFQHDAVS